MFVAFNSKIIHTIFIFRAFVGVKTSGRDCRLIKGVNVDGGSRKGNN